MWLSGSWIDYHCEPENTLKLLTYIIFKSHTLKSYVLKSYKKGKNSQVVKVMAESQSMPRAKASFYLKVFIELNK